MRTTPGSGDPLEKCSFVARSCPSSALAVDSSRGFEGVEQNAGGMREDGVDLSCEGDDDGCIWDGGGDGLVDLSRDGDKHVLSLVGDEDVDLSRDGDVDLSRDCDVDLSLDGDEDADLSRDDGVAAESIDRGDAKYSSFLENSTTVVDLCLAIFLDFDFDVSCVMNNQAENT